MEKYNIRLIEEGIEWVEYYYESGIVPVVGDTIVYDNDKYQFLVKSRIIYCDRQIVELYGTRKKI